MLAEREITAVLMRYCRALDRMDRQLAATIWHADGTADYRGIFHGLGSEFIDWVWQVHASGQAADPAAITDARHADRTDPSYALFAG